MFSKKLICFSNLSGDAISSASILAIYSTHAIRRPKFNDDDNFKFFHKDFPHIVDYKDSEDSKKENTGKATQSSEENNSVENKSEEQTKQPEEKKTVIQKEKLFSKWIIGEPFFSEEIVQIPVRLYCKYGTIDVTLYLNRQNSNAVNLITIDRWKKI